MPSTTKDRAPKSPAPTRNSLPLSRNYLRTPYRSWRDPSSPRH